MVTRLALLLALVSACTISSPFGVECVSDQNCGCANCCIAYRCAAVGPLINDAGSMNQDAGTMVSDAGPRSWTVSTFAGSTRGFRDAKGTDAQLASPSQLALDSNGLLYVADTGNNCIRTIDPDGNVATLAPNDWPCGGTALDGPEGVAVDPSGNVYVANTGKNCVLRRTAAGVVSVIGGSCSQQANECLNTPNPSRFTRPSAVAFSDPYLLVTEIIGNRVRWIDLRSSSVGTLAGQGTGTAPLTDGTCSFATQCSGSATGAKFNGPSGIAVASPGVLYVTDVYNCALRRMQIQPGCAITTLGRAGCPMFVSEDTSGIIRNAWGVAAGRGPLAGLAVVADTGNHRIATVDDNGVLGVIAGTRVKGFMDGPALEAQFQFPAGIAVDGSGRIFVSDGSNHRIRLVEPK